MVWPPPGTTTALVFGSHFPGAQEALFAAAVAGGLRVFSGLVVSDRGLLPSLHVSRGGGVEASRQLIERWHGRGLLRYAVTPRFSVSCSDEMLAMCGELVADAAPGLLFTTHLNEIVGEISLVRSLFPWARDYLETYERYGLLGSLSVFAHNVHPTDDELHRLATAGATVAHCPSLERVPGERLVSAAAASSTQACGSRSGADVGAGTGFGDAQGGADGVPDADAAARGCSAWSGSLALAGHRRGRGGR